MSIRRKAAAVAAGACLLAGGAFLPAAQANNCVAGKFFSTVTVGTGDSPTIYIDNRNATGTIAQPAQGIWFYMESNGHKGLQRGGGQSITLGEYDNCNDGSGLPPDTIIL